ncbi:MAG: hypothetical protein KBG73_10470, partial [Candidatus Promineofilum sp.]|nr:hypothetical protein [Promineifilum sp.]
MFALCCLLVLAGCGPQPALPTRAAPALSPPTPAVIVPTPTLAAVPPPSGRGLGRGSEAGETGSRQAEETATPPEPTLVAEAEGTADPLPTPLPKGEGTSPCVTPGRVEQGTLDSAVAGQPMRYRVYLPPCYGQDGRVYPTLTLFGGNIHDDSFWDTLGIDEAAEAAILAGDIPPLLIVMPDNGLLANTTTSGPTSYEGFVLNELIPHIERTTCAWPARE